MSTDFFHGGYDCVVLFPSEICANGRPLPVTMLSFRLIHGVLL